MPPPSYNSVQDAVCMIEGVSATGKSWSFSLSSSLSHLVTQLSVLKQDARQDESMKSQEIAAYREIDIVDAAFSSSCNIALCERLMNCGAMS